MDKNLEVEYSIVVVETFRYLALYFNLFDI